MAGSNPMNGRAISEVGINTYLTNEPKLNTSNINFFASQEEQIRNWNECNFGCHTPSYRMLNRQPTYSEFINLISKASPLLAGTIDGVYSTGNKIGEGLDRTGEGLGLEGSDRIAEIGAENRQVFLMAKNVFIKLLSMDINLVDNPITEMVIRIINAYTKAIPHEIMIPIIENGKITYENLDMAMVSQAIRKGLINIDVSEGIGSSADFLKNNSGTIQQFAGKVIGKKIATEVAVILAIQIAKELAKVIARSPLYVKFLKFSPADKSPKGLAGVVVTLLKLQGTLQICSNSSLRLRSKCPTLWNELNRGERGLDLLYFLIEDYVSEYVDRISLAEKDPAKFVEMIKALVATNYSAENIFFPFSKT